MNFEKIKNIKLSLMEVDDDTNMDPTKLDFIIRSSISINIEDLDFIRSEESMKTILTDMYNSLEPYKTGPNINYIGIWIKYGDELLGNSIRLQTLEDIKKYSVEDINGLYEFMMMTLPA